MIRNMIEPKTLKGFRDFLPKEARKRQYVIDKLRAVFESYGFEPLETPALEYEEILAGKYGEEGERLMYKFEDKGGRKVALRYDQTVPLARVVAQYQNDLPLPFKRYQISNVWRGENPQKGRFREFLQCDIDTVGTSSFLADAEIIEVAIECLRRLGFKKYKVLINDRSTFKNVDPTMIGSLDKLKKIGRDGVIKELKNKGFEEDQLVAILDSMESKKVSPEMLSLFALASDLGVDTSKFEFSPTLARGLDYYTGMIFEIEIDGYEAGSVCGGGRYDNLIGMFANQQIPAVGCAFGFDRIIEAMGELNLFPKDLISSRVLVTIFSPELANKSIEVASTLRSNNINVELYPDENIKLDKQLKFADQKGIPYVVIIGPEEEKNNIVTLRNMKTREQRNVNLDELKDALT